MPRRPNLVEADDADDFSQLTTATRRDDYEQDYEGPCLIRVIAPATLEEGYTFDVLVDEEPYTVQVPSGGVKEGQEFEVEYLPDQQYKYYHGNSYRNQMERVTEGNREDGLFEDGEESELKELPTQTLTVEEEEESSGQVVAIAETNAVWYDKNGTPIGGWRTGLCGCCDVLTQSTFWMGFVCTPILMAQLLDRLRLTWNGSPGPKEQTSLSYNRILLSLVFTMAFFWVPVLGWVLVFTFYAVVVIYVGSRVRAYIRQKYKIPAKLPFRCGQYLDDFFFMLLCGCCSTIQMARHTHDDKEYPGHGCTTTGLGPDAPDIV